MAIDKTQFYSIFKTEAEEHLQKLNEGLLILEKDPHQKEVIQELFRRAHTLKGAARMIGFEEIGTVSHKIEDIFDLVRDGKLAVDSNLIDKLLMAVDFMKHAMEELLRGQKVSLDVNEVCSELEAVLTERRLKPAATAEGPEAKPEEKSAPMKLEEFIKVPLAKIDKLLGLVGEVVINKVIADQRLRRLKTIAKHAKRLKRQLSELEGEFQHLPVSKSIPELRKLSVELQQCVKDIDNLKDELSLVFKGISDEAFRMGPVVDELQEGMKEIKLLPVSTVLDMMPRVVRDISRQQKKEVKLEIEGADTQLDKKVLERIKDPLIHILRNCVDHGVEPPDKRVASGKPRSGLIKLAAQQKGDSVFIEVKDDGPGLDLEKIKRTAIEKKLVAKEALKQMSDKQLANLIFIPGFTTSPLITDVSGRGVGLDVVKQNVQMLRGEIAIESKKGKGTKVTIELPLTITVIRAILVTCEDEVFAIPIARIKENIVIAPGEVRVLDGKESMSLDGELIPLFRLEELLGIPRKMHEDLEPQRRSARVRPALVISHLDQKIGIVVDQVFGEQEIFLKSLGEYLGRVRNISGATILDSGDVVVVLDTADLVASSLKPIKPRPVQAVRPKEKKKRNILVVEDSFATREMEKSVLKDHGYEVDTAQDAEDALNKLSQKSYDLFVIDVVLPGMDGFQLCATLREKKEYKETPVIIVTFTKEETGMYKCLEVGAQAYIVKSAFDQKNLVDTVDRLLSEHMT